MLYQGHLFSGGFSRTVPIFTVYRNTKARFGLRGGFALKRNPENAVQIIYGGFTGNGKIENNRK